MAKSPTGKKIKGGPHEPIEQTLETLRTVIRAASKRLPETEIRRAVEQALNEGRGNDG